MERKIGSHTLAIEGDVLKLTAHGYFTVEDMKLFLDISAEHTAQFGYRLVLHDLTDAKDLTAEARRYTAARVREDKLKGRMYLASASFGAGRIARAMMSLFYAMLRLTSRGDHTNYIAKSEADARAFLDEQRLYFQAQLQHGR